MENDTLDIKQIIRDVFKAKVFIFGFTILVFFLSAYIYVNKDLIYTGKIKIGQLDQITNKYHNVFGSKELHSAFINNVFSKNILNRESMDTFVKDNKLDNFDDPIISSLYNSLEQNENGFIIVTSKNDEIIEPFLKLIVLNTNDYVKELSIEFIQSNIDKKLYQKVILNEIRLMFSENEELGEDFQLVQFMFENVSDSIDYDIDSIMSTLKIFQEDTNFNVVQVYQDQIIIETNKANPILFIIIPTFIMFFLTILVSLAFINIRRII